jgi:hypothetical protein
LEKGKECVYQFQAVAGASYSIRTALGTLRDSVLYLYGTDGKTQLAFNDDGDSDLASKISWVAPKSGTYYFKVTAFDKTLAGDFRVSLASTATTNAAQALSLQSSENSPLDHANASVSTEMSSPSSNSSSRFSDVAWHSTHTTLENSSVTLERNHSNSNLRETREYSLLDHQAVRTAIGSMLFEESSSDTDPVRSMELHLDALDEFFARFQGVM